MMMRDLASVRQICVVGSDEAAALRSAEAPIMLLEKSAGFPLPEIIAPGNDRLGVMLPYSPLHALLLEEDLTWW